MTSKAVNHSPEMLIKLYSHGLKIEDLTLDDLVILFQQGLITVKELSLENQVRICGKGLIEIDDICQRVIAATEQSISIEELSKLYISCLDLEKICFYEKFTTVEQREMIAKKLFIDSIRAQAHWLEYMLRLLQQEHNNNMMDMLIKNMSITYYPVFCAVYKTLVAKESTPDLPSGEIKELRKLRKSMVKRVDENAFDCGKKLSSCIVQETRLEVIEKILEKIIDFQDSDDFFFLASSWSSIESIIKYPEAFGLENGSPLIKIATEVIAKRDEQKKKKKERMQ